MTYDIADDKVLWLGKPVKAADAKTFEILHEKIGRDASHVFFGASQAKVDAKSIEILSDGYARDANIAYEILQTKLKPLKKADAKSFEALSATYARDRRSAFFRDKPLRKCNLKALRPIHKLLATDGERLFWTNTPLPLPPAPFDMEHVSAEVSGKYEVNRPAIVLHDGARVVFMTDGEEKWSAPVGADPATFEILEPLWQLYQKDRNHVYFRGKPLAGADPASAEMLGKHILRCKAGLWCGSIALHEEFEAEDLTPETPAAIRARIDPKAIVWADDNLYRDSAYVWRMRMLRRGDDNPVIEAIARTLPPATDCDAALRTAYGKIAEILFHIFDTWLPLELGTNDLDEELDKALKDGKRKIPVTAMPDYKMTRKGSMISVSVTGLAIAEVPVSGWLTLFSTLWASAGGRRDRLILYPQVGYMLPDGDEMVVRIATRLQDELIDLANALHAAGETHEANAIAHQVLYRGHRHSDLRPALVARCAPDLLAMLHYDERHYEFSQTTNLAAARQVIATKMLEDPDFRVRYEGCRVLHSTTANTNQDKHFVNEIIPAVTARLEKEQAGYVREMLHAIVECMLVRGFRIPGNTDIHALMAPYVELQLKHQVNTDLNRGRKIVALLAAGRDEDAAAAQQELLADVSEQKAPPMYSSNMAFRTWELWLLANACEIASLQNAEEKLKPGRGAALRAERDRLFEGYGKPKDWWEFQYIARYIAK
jgi:hypothetical protein